MQNSIQGDFKLLSKTKQLIVFVAHLDDVELSCLSYIFKNHTSYDSISIFIASEWKKKKGIWSKNLESIRRRCEGTEVEYINLGFEQRSLMGKLDDVKDLFYNLGYNVVLVNL